MTQNSTAVLNYVKENGGRISIDELVTALGRDKRSINASVTDICYRDAEGAKFKKEEGKTDTPSSGGASGGSSASGGASGGSGGGASGGTDQHEFQTGIKGGISRLFCIKEYHV